MKKFSIIILLIVVTISLFGFTPIKNLDNQTELLIMMYHSVIGNKRERYIISTSQFENDIKLFISLGYTPILPKDLKHFVEGKIALPQKTILISFDDGEYNFLYYALPILNKYNFKANMNVVGKFTNFASTCNEPKNPNYSYLTWGEIKYLSDLENVEIGNHTFDMHNQTPRFGINMMKNEDEGSYKKVLRTDIVKLQSALLQESNCIPITFAFPFGQYNNLAISELKKLGFSIFLTCNEGINYLKVGDTQKLPYLKRINREGSYSNEKLKQLISKYSTAN